MWKLYLVLIALLFTGCSHFRLNAAMCNKIMSDPTATVPEECRNYSKEEAEKAFNKNRPKTHSKEDIIEFNKNSKDENE